MNFPQRIRSLGKSRFIWMVGVLCWGVPFGILFPLMIQFTTEDPGPVWGHALRMLPFSIPLGMAGGWLFGYLMWLLRPGLEQAVGAGASPGRPVWHRWLFAAALLVFGGLAIWELTTGQMGLGLVNIALCLLELAALILTWRRR